MKPKKLTPNQIKKINDRIRFLQYKSWDSTVSEVNKIRDEIHVLRMKLDEDTLLKIQEKKTPPKNPISKTRKGLRQPVTKGLTTLCAKTVGVTGRRKKDGTQKKGFVAAKGGGLKPKKKSTSTKKK